MQRNFILTDVMKTGFHVDLEDYIHMNTFTDQTFDMTGEYYTLHNFDLDGYDRRFAIIDYRVSNLRFEHNNEFNTELQKRCDLLHSQGFKFIKATPWESLDNVKQIPCYPDNNIPHINWTGGVSWFWFYMWRKHHNNNFVFDHSHKPFDFLYLNKEARSHRQRLLKALPSTVLDKSLYSNWPHKKLDQQYELPWAKDYPQRGLDQDLYELPYNHTKFSLVSETNDSANEVFVTEKIWKPIIAQQPFVVHGNHLYLQKLREIGFKTFGQYFDESYDLELDPDQRIQKIVALCEHLQTINWKDLYLQTQALRQHNYDVLFDKEKLGAEINKQLNLFFEFVDRG
jgi:uncharacterized ubiquitin-like protein YukD